jgi:hypothetical protein
MRKLRTDKQASITFQKDSIGIEANNFTSKFKLAKNSSTPKKKRQSFSKFIEESAEKIKRLSNKKFELEKESWNLTESESSTVKKRPPPMLLDKENIDLNRKPLGSGRKNSSLGTGIKTLNFNEKTKFESSAHKTRPTEDTFYFQSSNKKPQSSAKTEYEFDYSPNAGLLEPEDEDIVQDSTDFGTGLGQKLKSKKLDLIQEM